MSEQIPPNLQQTGLSLEAELVASSTIHKNLGQEFIVTTTDKATLCLIHYQQALDAKSQWLAPAGILLSVATTLVAAEFRSFLGIRAEVWQATFFITGLASAIWLLITLTRAWQTRKQRGLDEVVKRLKQSSISTEMKQ